MLLVQADILRQVPVRENLSVGQVKLFQALSHAFLRSNKLKYRRVLSAAYIYEKNPLRRKTLRGLCF
jgi:hypothetical protein